MGSDRWNESPRPGFPAPERDDLADLRERVARLEATSIHRPMLNQGYVPIEELREAQAEARRFAEGEKYHHGEQMKLQRERDAMRAVVEAARAYINRRSLFATTNPELVKVVDAITALDRATGKEGDHG